MSDQRNLLLVLEMEPGAGSDEAERLGRRLRAKLAQLDVEADKPAATTEIPEGATGNVVDWGSLLLTFDAAGGAFTSVISLVRVWLARHNAAQRTKITIDNGAVVLDRPSALEREQLVSARVHRHSGG
jgi:hypothetical protein